MFVLLNLDNHLFTLGLSFLFVNGKLRLEFWPPFQLSQSVINNPSAGSMHTHAVTHSVLQPVGKVLMLSPAYRHWICHRQ